VGGFQKSSFEISVSLEIDNLLDFGQNLM